MLKRERGIAPVVAALLVVLILVAGGSFLYLGTQDHSTTYTTTETFGGPTATVTAPPVTTTATVISSTTVISLVASLPAGTTTTTTTATTTVSCAYASTASAGNQSASSQFVELAQNFTSISMTFGENTTSGPVLVNDSYLLVETAPNSGYTSYEMAFTETGNGSNGTATAWLLSNGTLLATEINGQNSTGVSASNELDAVAGPFVPLLLYNYAPDLVAPLSGVSSTQSTVNIGGVNMEVMNYEGSSTTPSSPPALIECLGPSTDAHALTGFELQSGVVPGTNFNLLTYLDAQGTVSSSSGSGYTSPYSIYEKVLSFETVQEASTMTDTMSGSM